MTLKKSIGLRKKKKKKEEVVKKTKEEILSELSENICCTTSSKTEDPDISDIPIEQDSVAVVDEKQEDQLNPDDLIEVNVPFVFTREKLDQVTGVCLYKGYVDFADYVRDIIRGDGLLL